MNVHNRQGVTTRVDQRVGLRVDPKVVVSSRILELQRFELESAIQQEITDNPALELLEEASDPIDEAELLRELSGEQEPSPVDDDFDTYAPKIYGPDDSVDWTDFVAAPITLHDHLLGQLLPLVHRELSPLARYIVDCVEPTGYLDTPIEEIAHATGHSLRQAKSVLKKLQSCEPAGVGAHDLRECLLLQLVGSTDEITSVARILLTNHWDTVPVRKAPGLARKLGVSESLISDAFDKIATLSPYPGDSFVAERGYRRSVASGAVTPDIVYHRDDRGVRFEVRGCDSNQLCLNPWYKQRYREIKREAARASTEEFKHIREYVGRAVNFIRAIHQRKQTLGKIAACLLEHELPFISTGSYRFLRGDTRVRLAKAIDLHESTVSRATMGKFVQLANRDIVSFEVFFKPALRVQKMIEEILATENPSRPLSDREIAAILRQRGISVARRTVSKYREQCRMLSSHQRRTA